MKIDKYFLNVRFSEIYNRLISEEKVRNKLDLATKMDINQSSISEILSKRQGVTIEFIQKFCNIFEDYTPNDFFNDEKLNHNHFELKNNNESYIPIAKATKNLKEGIPLLSVSAMAGYFKGDNQVLEYDCERFIIPTFKDAEFLINIKGGSMYPKYSSGDIVACKKLPRDTFFQWNKVYVLDTVQGPLIKRIQEGTDADSLLIISDNPDYKPFELNKSQIRGIAIVIGVIRLE